VRAPVPPTRGALRSRIGGFAQPLGSNGSSAVGHHRRRRRSPYRRTTRAACAGRSAARRRSGEVTWTAGRGVMPRCRSPTLWTRSGRIGERTSSTGTDRTPEPSTSVATRPASCPRPLSTSRGRRPDSPGATPCRSPCHLLARTVFRASPVRRTISLNSSPKTATRTDQPTPGGQDSVVPQGVSFRGPLTRGPVVMVLVKWSPQREACTGDDFARSLPGVRDFPGRRDVTAAT
jgi:hypothetical protein